MSTLVSNEVMVQLKLYARSRKKMPPRLADGLTTLDIVRHALDGIKAGGKPVHNAGPEYFTNARSSLPIDARGYVESTRNNRCLTADYGHLESSMGIMLPTEQDVGPISSRSAVVFCERGDG